MIKISDFIRRKPIVFAISVLCIVALSGSLIINRVMNSKAAANNTNYTVSSKTSNVLEDAISEAIKTRLKAYNLGEFAAEGHITLETENNNGKITAYTVSSLGIFGFENGVFTVVSGSSAIPTVMTFSQNKAGKYTLLDYKEPLEGDDNLKSTKNMFPKKLWDKVLARNNYSQALAKQEQNQAQKYLQSIKRNAKVSTAYVERKLPKINTQASNKLFAGVTKGSELNNYPYWLGTKELLENGVRHIYETSQGKTDDGYDLITFKETNEDGTVVKIYKYKIVGKEPVLIK